MLRRALLLPALFAALAADARAITVNTVYVGDVGNAADPATGGIFGAVAYDYRIGQTEETIGQYTAFLNAVAATDSYGLYNTNMATDPAVAGIARAGTPGNYIYSTIGSPNKPITYVSWGDAARFSNWLHNGQPTGPQNASTTENGAYPLNGAITDAALNSVVRSAGARWFLPTENEWYKAAYHQATSLGGDSDNYWTFPTRANSSPASDQPPGLDAPNQANAASFFSDDGLANSHNDGFAVTGLPGFDGNQNYLTEVGAYALSISHYYTFDQGGSLEEWNETLIDGTLRGLRGGSWIDLTVNLQASTRISYAPTQEPSDFGFRVATVPEPSSLVLAALGLVGLVVWKRRRQSQWLDAGSERRVGSFSAR